MNGMMSGDEYMRRVQKGSTPGTVAVPDGVGVVRYWDHIHPTAQTRLADDIIDAILRDVFQGQRNHLRGQMRAVAYKAIRKHEWPYFEECVEKAVAERVAALREPAAATGCEAGYPDQSCQGCDAGNCAMLPGFTPDEEEQP